LWRKEGFAVNSNVPFGEDVFGCFRCDDAGLLLLVVEGFGESTGQVFFFSENFETFEFAFFDFCWIGGEEGRSDRENATIYQGEGNGKVVTFITPAPGSGSGWFAKDANVVEVRLANGPAVFQFEKNGFEGTDRAGLKITFVTEGRYKEGMSQNALMNGHFLDGVAIAFTIGLDEHVW